LTSRLTDSDETLKIFLRINTQTDTKVIKGSCVFNTGSNSKHAIMAQLLVCITNNCPPVLDQSESKPRFNRYVETKGKVEPTGRP